MTQIDRDDWGPVSHRQGAWGFAGVFAALVLATIVTDSFTADAMLVLAGVLAGTGFALGTLVATHLVHRRAALLIWPIASCVGVSALDHVAHPASSLLMGLVVLSFLFIGLTQPPRRGLWLVPPAAALFVQIVDLDTRQVAVRLPIAALVWIICSEVPARLMLDLREKQAALELLATTDSLTGLLNRSRLDVHLERVGANGAVALIDLDHFKQFNDTHGHVAGDVVLMDFATILRDGARSGDAVFRYGGEEFLVVLPETSLEETAAVLRRIRERWSQHGSALTFSAGVTHGGLGAVRAADTLLYQAKAGGRDRVVVDAADSAVA